MSETNGKVKLLTLAIAQTTPPPQERFQVIVTDPKSNIYPIANVARKEQIVDGNRVYWDLCRVTTCHAVPRDRHGNQQLVASACSCSTKQTRMPEILQKMAVHAKTYYAPDSTIRHAVLKVRSVNRIACARDASGELKVYMDMTFEDGTTRTRLLMKDFRWIQYLKHLPQEQINKKSRSTRCF